MSVYLQRSTNIYISKAANASANATNTVLLNVKDFSFNKSASVVNVGRSTISPTQQRTVKPYVNTVAPVNFSFTTYVLPVVDTVVTSPEEYLWVSLLGVDSISSSATTSTINFANGNVAQLQELTLWFDDPNKSEGNYRIDNAIVDEATISFDINGIAEIRWSGRGLALVEDNTPPAATDRTGQTNYLKNKLSTMILQANAVSYTLALTGGQIRIDNKVTFYGRVQLGKTTVPTGHFTGNREITGNLNFYLKSGTNASVDLFNTLNTNVSTDTYESTYLANITINVGGATAPFLQINVPQALLNIPTLGFNELITMNVPFIAQEEAGNYSTVIYNMP